MTYEELIAAMTPEMHASLKQAVELGKWPDGRRLSDEQRDICMRAVIAYDMEKLPPEARVGFIDRTSRTAPSTGKTRWPLKH
ncbi:YeaC family protein [Pontibacterium sp.]|uniref:YeaC family protein n=1 Tax=Pontibacterium sp. TaxID=2036026 RepID=UPI0035151962